MRVWLNLGGKVAEGMQVHSVVTRTNSVYFFVEKLFLICNSLSTIYQLMIIEVWLIKSYNLCTFVVPDVACCVLLQVKMVRCGSCSKECVTLLTQ